ncbi:hypothetical protein XarjCFBP8253_19895 [Xanthomonas arboricola pv. juglandis]|nr:hypothetical protein C1H21_09795 [Xanthomonas arboricola pv. juglandis]PPT96318.1 hypothetical protein XarjCFBP8253_19895 [Xanthomonas arboricola pv. juglandis]
MCPQLMAELSQMAVCRRTLTPTPAPRPGPGPRRSKARADMARKPCLLAPTGEGLCPSPGIPLPGL